MYCSSKQKNQRLWVKIISVSCISAIVNFILIGCNGGGSSYNTASSATAQISGIPGKPKVLSINPANDAMNVSQNTSITVTYDYPVKSVNTTTFTVAEEFGGSNIDGEITAKGDNLTFTFTPAESLIKNTKYKVNLKGVENYENIEGGSTEDFSSSFYTESLHIIFTTHQSWWGARIEDIAGADRKCQDEADKWSFGGTYKAMIVGDNRTLVKRWVLKANTKYFNLFNQLVGTTNESAIFNQEYLDNYIYDRDGHTHKIVWTGMTSDWKVSDDICDNWDGYDDSDDGMYGSSNTKETKVVIHHANEGCYTTDININDVDEGHLYCIWQEEAESS